MIGLSITKRLSESYFNLTNLLVNRPCSEVADLINLYQIVAKMHMNDAFSEEINPKLIQFESELIERTLNG